MGGGGQRIRQGKLAGLDGVKGQAQGHHLGNGGTGPHLVRIFFKKHLSAGGLHQHRRRGGKGQSAVCLLRFGFPPYRNAGKHRGNHQEQRKKQKKLFLHRDHPFFPESSATTGLLRYKGMLSRFKTDVSERISGRKNPKMPT